MNANPLEHLHEAHEDLERILELRQRKRFIRLYENHDEEWLSDLLRDKVTVVCDRERATELKPEICDYEFENGYEEEELVIDCSQCPWEPEEGRKYSAMLPIRGSDDDFPCRWSVKHFSAAISPKLWLLTVEFCDQ